MYFVFCRALYPPSGSNCSMENRSMDGGSGVEKRITGLKTVRLWAQVHRTHRTRFFAQKNIGTILSWKLNLKLIRYLTAVFRFAVIVCRNIMMVVSTVIRSRSTHPTVDGPEASTMRAVAAGLPHWQRTPRLAMPFGQGTGTNYELLPSVIRFKPI